MSRKHKSLSGYDLAAAVTHRRLKVTQQVGNDSGLVLEPAPKCCSSGCQPKLTSFTTTPSKLNILQSYTPTFSQVKVIKDNK